MNFDVDFAALFEERPLSDALQAGREDTELNTVVITALLKNEDFKALFLSRLAMHLRTTYDTQRVLSQLNALAEQVGADIARNQARWVQRGHLAAICAAAARFYRRRYPARI